MVVKYYQIFYLGSDVQYNTKCNQVFFMFIKQLPVLVYIRWVRWNNVNEINLFFIYANYRISSQTLISNHKISKILTKIWIICIIVFVSSFSGYLHRTKGMEMIDLPRAHRRTNSSNVPIKSIQIERMITSK